MKNKLRLGFLPVVVVLLLALLQGTSLAQQPSPDLPSEKANQFLELLSDPELKAWLEGKIPAATDEPGLSISEDILSLEAGIRARIGALGAAIPRLPEELSRATDVVSRDVNSGRPGLVMG
ncbi:MAG: mechanosensitive ion channel family protein, partial [Mesorhizobium sp.]